MVSEEDPDEDASATDSAREELRKAQDRLGEGADRAVEGFDESVVDLLSWLLDTETRARIYVYLREHPESTSEEVADGTGLYPSTVREALAELHEEGKVERGKRQSSGAGNNPYEYEAIAPSDLVRGIVGQVQSELNAVFNLDRRLGGDAAAEDEDGPVRISVETDEGAGESDAEGDESEPDPEEYENVAEKDPGPDSDVVSDTATVPDSDSDDERDE